jgi:hypothetical protein
MKLLFVHDFLLGFGGSLRSAFSQTLAVTRMLDFVI